MDNDNTDDRDALADRVQELGIDLENPSDADLSILADEFGCTFDVVRQDLARRYFLATRTVVAIRGASAHFASG